MKINNVFKSAKALAQKAAFKVKFHSPEILAAVGVVTVVAGTVVACRATRKIDACFDELNDMHEQLEQLEDETVREAVAEKYEEKYGEEFTDDVIIRDKIGVYARTGARLLKLYAPAVLLICFGIAAMLGSNYILRNRWIGASAAYTALSASVKEYRKRVAEEVGEDAEKNLFNNVGTVDVFEDGPDGTMSNVTKKPVIGNGRLGSPYAIIFDEHNRNWKRDAQYNKLTIQCALNTANSILNARGYLYLYEVYELLGFRYEPKNGRFDMSEEQARMARYVGWVKDGDGDGYVEFGKEFDIWLTDTDCDYEPSVLLDFNVDGDILNTMFKRHII